MKTIGLIGGMSWESSAEYYRVINEEVKKGLADFILLGAFCIALILMKLRDASHRIGGIRLVKSLGKRL